MIWTVWDLTELIEATVSRDCTGWRLNLDGKPLGFNVKNEGTTPGLYLTLFFREREQLERALARIKDLAFQLSELGGLDPGDVIAGALPEVEEEVKNSRALDKAVDSFRGMGAAQEASLRATVSAKEGVR